MPRKKNPAIRYSHSYVTDIKTPGFAQFYTTLALQPEHLINKAPLGTRFSMLCCTVLTSRMNRGDISVALKTTGGTRSHHILIQSATAKPCNKNKRCSWLVITVTILYLVLIITVICSIVLQTENRWLARVFGTEFQRKREPPK